jgi:hypothetical protein
METNTQHVPDPALAELVGAIKSFGEYGPMYEVLGPAPRSERGEMVHIRVVIGGEELADPLVP